MEPLEVISLQDKFAEPIPYRGPLYRLRPLVKWVVVAVLVLYVGVFTLLLQEQTLWEAARNVGILLVICLAWLIPTRTRSRMAPPPMTIAFYEDHMVWERQPRAVTGLSGAVRIQKRVDTISYQGITGLRLQTLYHRLEVRGSILCEIYRQDKRGTLHSSPDYRKQANASVVAYLKEYNPPELEERLLAALERYTGKPVERYDPTAAGPKKERD